MGALVFVVLVASRVVIAPNGVLPAGARLVARMNTTIGTTHSLGIDRIADETRAGAPFAATVETPVLDEGGRALLPAGALVHGHVARLERGSGVRRAVLELAVDRLDRRPLLARVVAADVEQLDNADAGAQVADTTFWGAVFGGIVFGIPGVAIGHGFAGTFGAVNAVRARTVEAWLSAGSLVTIELDAPLRLSAPTAARRPSAPRRAATAPSSDRSSGDLRECDHCRSAARARPASSPCGPSARCRQTAP